MLDELLGGGLIGVYVVLAVLSARAVLRPRRAPHPELDRPGWSAGRVEGPRRSVGGEDR